jgi:hypothetical protein
VEVLENVAQENNHRGNNNRENNANQKEIEVPEDDK